MFLYAIAASVVSIVLTLAITQLSTALTMLGIIFASWLTGLILLCWFAKAEKRVPEPKEFKYFYMVYGGICTLAIFAFVLSAGTVRFTWIVWARILIYGVAYSVFIRLIFSQNRINALLEKNHRKSSNSTL